MKKIIFSIMGLMLLLSGCQLLDHMIPSKKTGSLQVVFHFSASLSLQTITNDLSQVDSGKVFLKQGGATQYQGNLTLDLVNKTGICSISSIHTGNYDILVELYDSGGRVLYQGQDSVTINPGANGTKNIALVKNIGKLTITGKWTEDADGLAVAVVQLKKNSTVVCAGNLLINTSGKNVSGGIDDIYPDSYEVYIEIRNAIGTVLFAGSQSKTITAGDNSVTISLVIKTGSIAINLNGDLTAPVITAGPNVSVNGSEVTITWSTDENATSNVCYSITQGFNYRIQTDWVPVGRDLSADRTSHSVIISELANATYYYVVVSVDAGGNVVVSDENNFTTSYSAGAQITYSVGGVSFKMRYVPGKSFPTGVDDDGTATINNAYWIAETEVTYEWWSTIYTWAVNNGYLFANVGGRGSSGSGLDTQPVTCINWRDAMVWCNALTEYYNTQNGTSLACVYKYGDVVIRDSRDANATAYDNVTADASARGFRLPESMEWELAARYKNDADNDGDIRDAGEYYPGTYASGATADYNDETATGVVAVYNTSGTAVVKSKTANALGLYDISGNVWEWCFDWYSGIWK